MGGPNGNAGGQGQLYKFTCDIGNMLPCNYKEEVHDRGCSGYIHMDDERYGKSGGQYTLQDCADAVKRLNGEEGCKGQFFFFEDSGNCNCPTDDCNEGPNGNAGSPGQLYKFTCEHEIKLSNFALVMIIVSVSLVIGTGAYFVYSRRRKKGRVTDRRPLRPHETQIQMVGQQFVSAQRPEQLQIPSLPKRTQNSRVVQEPMQIPIATNVRIMQVEPV